MDPYQVVRLEAYDRLVQQLRENADHLMEYFKQDRPRAGKKDTYGIEGNTFRGFQGFSHPPSKTYWAWAEGYIEKVVKKKKPPLDERDFLKWREEAALHLEEFWPKYQTEKSDKEGKKLGFAHKNKAINLFFKYLTRTTWIDGDLREVILEHGHIPLDKFAQIKLRQFVQIKGVLYAQARTGLIDTQGKYDVLQKAIREITRAAGVPNLVFDADAWDEQRED